MMKKIILFLFLIIIPAFVCSCVSAKVYAPVMSEFTPPENAELSVRDIRVKGFTLDWTDPAGSQYGYEYAIAVSHAGNIKDYENALENDNIVLDFTPAYILNGTYKITKLIPGKEYEIKLFVRAKNVKVDRKSVV